MFVPARAAFAWCVPKRGCSLLRHSGSPGEWDSCFVPWCAVGKALRGLLWPWARIQSLRRALSSSPRVCASSSPLLPWLCSTCWQQALRGMVWQGHATYRAWFGLMGWSELSQSLLLQDALKPAFTVTNLPGTTSIQTAPTTSTSMQVSSGPSFPITNYLAPVSASISPNAVTSANGTVLKTTGASAVTSGGLMPIPTGFTLMSGQCL